MSKRNSFFDKEIYEKVNKENKILLEDYILEMKSEGKSKGTITQYTADIKMFYCWLYKEFDNISILKLRRKDFRRFFLLLSSNNTSSSRINRVQCSIRNLLEFAVTEEDDYDYEINMMRNIKGLEKERVREIFFLSDEQVTYLINYLLKEEKYQQALYLSLSYDSAARRNEVYQVLKKDFLENNKTNEVIGKRNKKFSLLYFSRTKRIAELYFKQRGEDSLESLWVIEENGEKRKASYSTLYYWITSLRGIIQEEFNQDLDFGPHSLRHSSLENYENGSHYTLKELNKPKLPLEVLKILANHESIETTQSYLVDKDQEFLNEAFGL